MGRPAKHQIQEFNGRKYYRKGSGYFKAGFLPERRTRYMHRDVWEFHNGHIPDGFEIHHRDHDKGNNDLGNLELVESRGHASYHGRKRATEKPDAARKHMERIRPLASKWHGSKAGLEWHSEHGKATWENRELHKYKCIQCGKKYEALAGTRKKGYCSPACQSAARRESGVDNEQRKCVVCDRPFIVNRYTQTRTCSKACWRIALSRSRSS
jgi:hypothetical protein